MKPRTILESINSKPSAAIKAMCRGLRKPIKERGFKIDMNVYGSVDDGVCFGCAATCAIQELAGYKFGINEINFISDNTHGEFLFSKHEVLIFENAMDDVRIGDFENLFEFCGLDYESCSVVSEEPRICMANADYKSQIKPLSKFAKYLESQGY